MSNLTKKPHMTGAQNACVDGKEGSPGKQARHDRATASRGCHANRFGLLRVTWELPTTQGS